MGPSLQRVSWFVATVHVALVTVLLLVLTLHAFGHRLGLVAEAGLGLLTLAVAWFVAWRKGREDW
jgi:hypothetical protein